MISRICRGSDFCHLGAIRWTGELMYEYAIIWDWLAFAVRWLHVITGIAWIGSSFYFVALDLGLKKVPHLPVGAYGEEWQVHGGGFYHIQKYLVAPERMPEHLVWFKWESYATWLSGLRDARHRLLRGGGPVPRGSGGLRTSRSGPPSSSRSFAARWDGFATTTSASRGWRQTRRSSW